MKEVKAIENREKITYINRNIMHNLPKGLKEKLQDDINLAQAFIHIQQRVHHEHDKIIKKILG